MDPKNKGYEVAPLSTNQIKLAAKLTRAIASEHNYIDSRGKIDIVSMIELCSIEIPVTSEKNNILTLEVVPDDTLTDAEAKTFPNGTIQVRESVYDRACKDDPRSRFTLSHELFHALAHCNQMALSRKSTIATKAYRDSEWQANTFAANLLLPDELITKYDGMPSQDVSLYLGVSRQCIDIRRQQFKKIKS